MADNTSLNTMTGGDVIATDDLTTLNGGAVSGVKVQRVKVGYGVDGTQTDVSTTTPLPVNANDAVTTGTITAAAGTVVLQTIGGYSTGVIILSGTWAATIQFEASADGTNWIAIPMNNAPNGISLFTNQTVNTRNVGNIGGYQYLRARASSYTSGTVTVDIRASTAITTATPTLIAGIGGTSQVSIPSVTTPSDGVTSTSLAVMNQSLTYNGSTWDRHRAATSANGTTGTGVPASGIMGFDGTNYRRIQTTTSGAAAIGALTTGGLTPFTLISAATTNATSVKATAGTVYSIQASNTGASNAFLKLYNKATAPTVGTDTAVKTLIIPAGGGVVVPINDIGIAFGTGIALAITGVATTADATAVALAQVVVNLDYI